MPMKNIFQRSALILGLVLVAGCGPSAKPSGELEGKVTYKSAPVTEARIQIQSAETGYADGAVLSGTGTYKFTSLIPEGKYTVSIGPVSKLPVAGSTPEPVAEPQRSDIPTKYRTGSTSETTVTIAAGEKNTLDIDMKD